MFPNDALENWHSGQGHWAHIAPADWNDWKWQLKNRLTSLGDLEQYLELDADERAGCLFANQKLALAITPYFFNLINPADPADPIRRQVVPRAEETQTAPEERLDPVGEEESKAVDGIIHRYPCLLYTSAAADE